MFLPGEWIASNLKTHFSLLNVGDDVLEDELEDSQESSGMKGILIFFGNKEK